MWIWLLVAQVLEVPQMRQRNRTELGCQTTCACYLSYMQNNTCPMM